MARKPKPPAWDDHEAVAKWVHGELAYVYGRYVEWPDTPQARSTLAMLDHLAAQQDAIDEALHGKMDDDALPRRPLPLVGRRRARVSGGHGDW